jgi:transposase
VPEAVPHGHWKVLTILGALSTKGIQASMTVAAATDAEVFSSFVQHVLAPTLRPGQIVVMDNLSAHQQRQVRRLLAARRCHLWYWPPDSPDFNPMEFAWSKLSARAYARSPPKRHGTGLAMVALPYKRSKIAIGKASRQFGYVLVNWAYRRSVALIVGFALAC